MDTDTFKTIAERSEGFYREKSSRFLSFALPVQTVEEIREEVAAFRKEFYNARHICYAYMLGHERLDFRANDDGEPSGTAGKPILGQINSCGLTDILLVVVRYFGGVKLGTSGLIAAYKTAAANAIAHSSIIEKTVNETISITFNYSFLNEVMRIVKD
ncbi:MAG: YigZ family protein, partial [Bacteroidales bacterium]|nr:YigZ family protein [Bacteroidales bacterium]